MPFDASFVPEKYKAYKPIIAPKIKTDYKRPNHYNLKMRMCQNVSVDVDDESIYKFSPNILGDSMCSTVELSAY